MEELPTFSIVLPTYNRACELDACLENITSQDYPGEKLEILVIDGGSTDETEDVVDKYKDFNVKFIFNPKKLYEPGVALGYQMSEGDLVVFFSDDNILPRRDWFRKMAVPFMENPDLAGAYPQIVIDRKDNYVNRHYSYMHVEPFHYFVFGNEANPRLFWKAYPEVLKTEDYVIYGFSITNYPIVALAQCTVLRSGLIHDSRTEKDDILQIVDMIEKGYLFAYVPDAGIYHYSLKGFTHYIKKFKRRIELNLFRNIGYVGRDREKLISDIRRKKEKIWPFYSLLLVWPFVDGIVGAVREKDPAWLFHPVACFSFSCLIIFAYLKLMLDRAKIISVPEVS